MVVALAAAWPSALAQGAAQEPAPASFDAAAVVHEAREALHDWYSWPLARSKFERVLASPAGWYHPFAELGLAMLARAEGRVQDALEQLERVAKRIAAWPRDQALVRQAWAEWREERGRCFLALGLPDRAAIEFEAFARELDGGDAKARFGVEVANIDLLLAEQRATRALPRIVQALGTHDQSTPASRPFVEALRLRERVARLRVVQEPAAFRELAVELTDAFDAAPLASPLRARVGLDAVTAWLGAGDHEQAAACSERLLEPPFESPLREAEIRAQHARLALARSVPTAELVPLQAELARVAEALFAQWRRAPLREGGTGSFYFTARQEVLATLLQLDRRVGAGSAAVAAALAHLETALALGTLSRRFGGVAPDLAAVRRDFVPPGGGVLVFLVAPQGAHAILVDAAGAEHFETSLSPVDWEQIVEFGAMVQQAPVGDEAAAVAALRAHGERVARSLLPAAAQQRMAGWSSLLLVGDENQVATWHALPFGTTWLGLALPIAHVPSLSLAQGLRQRAAARPLPPASAPQLALVGDPELDPAVAGRWGIDVLQLRAEQRATLSGGVDPARTVTGWGKDASVQRLQSPEVRAAQALCVIAHGIEDFERERSAGIVLAQGKGAAGLVFAETVESLALPPLVALGVCGAAAGPARIGEDGAQHLGGACLLAGADCVLLARGQLPLGATVELLGAFFRGVQAGDHAALALQRARAAVAAQPHRAHPYYFAGLRLSGLGFTTPQRSK